MITFLTIHRGETIDDAKMIAVSVDPQLVNLVASHILDTPSPWDDPIIEELERGRRGALRLIAEETSHVPA